MLAADNHGNTDEAVLTFIPGEKADVGGGAGMDLVLEEYILWELADHNGNGKANPGERIRLFTTLRNKSSFQLGDVTGTLTSTEAHIAIEKDSVTYGRIPADDVLLPVDGFDVHIGSDILDDAGGHPYDARFVLEVADRDKTVQTWALPFTVPIYRLEQRPSTSGETPVAGESSIVTVVLDALPVSTTEAEIEVGGTATSTGAVIDTVRVLVNGRVPDDILNWDPETGRFSIVVLLNEGWNDIEAAATDLSGANGFDTANILLEEGSEPPDIEITSHIGGGLYGCGEGTLPLPERLRGTASAGGSEVASLTAEMQVGENVYMVPIAMGEPRNSYPEFSTTTAREHPP